MKSQLNIELIAAIKKSISEDANIVDVLMDLFPYMGKQTVYRRLRDEVPFTIEEVLRIARKFDISVDKLLGNVDSKQAVFDFDELEVNFFITYEALIGRYGQILRMLGKDRNSKALSATNALSEFFTMPYGNITKFRMYKWIYQTHNNPELSFSSIVVPTKLLNVIKSTVNELGRLKSYQLIIDNNFFSSIIEEIAFFYRRNLITKEELSSLQAELHALLDRLSEVTITGVNEFGCEVSIYLCSIQIDSTYIYMESGDYASARIKVYTIDGIKTHNSVICKKQRIWIESLKKFSTMITKSGEFERINFFRKQRELIAGMNIV